MADSEAKKRVSVTITYLEQDKRPVLPTPARPPHKIALMRADRPPVQFYRYMYRLVGDPHNWVSRRRMDDDTLVEIIHNPSVYVYILYVDGVPAGFAEIDGRNSDFHDIKFFGLAPEFKGRNLGRYFLFNILDVAWSHEPKKVRLETCTLDDPAALPLYQKTGFKVYDRREGVVELMDVSPPPN